MGIYANGQLIFGFIHLDENDELFTAIKEKAEEEYLKSGADIADFDENDFSSMLEDLQSKYNVNLSSIGYDSDVNIITTFSASVSAKGVSSRVIGSDKIEITKDYEERIKNFLLELNIEEDKFVPEWHLITYID